jgi:hypothetical protein
MFAGQYPDNLAASLELSEKSSANRYCLEKGQLAREKGAAAAIQAAGYKRTKLF